MLTPVILRPATLRGRPGWEVYEGEGVQPFYPVKSQAVGYAILRAGQCHRVLEYHDADGNVLKHLEPEESGALYRKHRDETPTFTYPKP